MAAAAITPRGFETAFIPASFPGVSFTANLLLRDFGFRAEPELTYPAQIVEFYSSTFLLN
jgi:hypothetical protein